MENNATIPRTKKLLLHIFIVDWVARVVEVPVQSFTGAAGLESLNFNCSLSNCVSNVRSHLLMQLKNNKNKTANVL